MRLDALVMLSCSSEVAAPLAGRGTLVVGLAAHACAVTFTYSVCCFYMADLQTSPKNLILCPGNSRALFSSVYISQDTGEICHSDFTAPEFTTCMV